MGSHLNNITYIPSLMPAWGATSHACQRQAGRVGRKLAIQRDRGIFSTGQGLRLLIPKEFLSLTSTETGFDSM